jgi:hypothetical protein
MKWLTKIGLVMGLLGCVAGLILCAINHVDFGTWGIVAFVAGIVVFGLLLSGRAIISYLKDNFDIEYSKKDGLKLREEK